MTINAGKRYMLCGSPYRGLIALALPVVPVNVVRALYDIIDTFFLAGIDGAVEAQAAVAIVTPLLGILIALTTGLGVGLVASASSASGAGNRKKLRKLSGGALLIGIVVAAVATVSAFLFFPMLLPFFAEGAALDNAAVYLKIRAFEIPAVMLFEIYRGERQAQGDTLSPGMILGGSLIVGIGLTAAIIAMGGGIAGAAAAKTAAQWLVTPFCAVGLFRSKKYATATFKGSAATVGKLLKLSAPAAAGAAGQSAGFAALQYMVRGYGNATLAAFSVCNRLTAVLTAPIFALSQVLTAFVGQNVGKRDFIRAEVGYVAARNLSIGLLTVLAVSLFWVRGSAVTLLSGDGEVWSAANEYLAWLLATLPLTGLLAAYTGYFNGYGKTLYTFIIESARLWALRLPLVVLLGLISVLGRSAVWYAMIASNFLVCFPAYFFRRHIRRTHPIKQ